MYPLYTIIDVRYWYQYSFPSLPSGRVDAFVGRNFAIEGDGDAKTAITDLRDIGQFVTKVINNERTLNKSVLCSGAVVSQEEAFRLLEDSSGEKIERIYVCEVPY
jgi:nucleoside-diphosphate-sugar epimerase